MPDGRYCPVRRGRQPHRLGHSEGPDTGEPLIVDSAYNKAGQLTSQYRARPYDGATSVGFGYNRNGNRVTEQTPGPDGSSNTNYPAWSLQDRQGSTIATTSAAGRVTDLVDYSDFGVPVVGSTGLAAATGYTGELTDVRPGINSYFSRSYDTFTGTWLTPDSWRGNTVEPTTLHRYGYIGNNPATDRDILGFIGSRMVLDGGGDIIPGSGTVKPSPADDPPCVGRGCRPAASESDTTDRDPPVCGARTLLPGCVPRETTQQQRDNAQTGWAILAGIGVALALGACIVATAGICAGVAAGIAGAGILGVMAAGGVIGGISSAVS